MHRKEGKRGGDVSLGCAPKGGASLGEEGVEALPGGLRAVEGAGVGDAARGDVAMVRHLAAAGDGEVVQEAPLVAEGGEGGELGVVVEAEVAEEGADDGAVLLLDAVVVVFAVGAGTGEPDVGVVGFEEGEEVVVEEFAAMAFRLWLRSVAVDVDGFGWEGELFEEVREGVGGGLGAAVPAGGKGAPLGGRVGDVEDPEEAFAHVAAAERDGVHLEDAGLAGFLEGAGAGGDLGRERGFVAGAFVWGAPDAVGAQDAVHRGGAHARELVGERRGDVVAEFLVIPDGAFDYALEVGRAHVAFRPPDPDEELVRVARVGGFAPAVLAMAAAPVEQTDDVFARITRHRDGRAERSFLVLALA